MRVVTYNLLHEPETWHVRWRLIVDQLVTLEADVIALQEVGADAGGGGSTAEKLAAALGMQLAQGGPIDAGRGLAWLVSRALTVTGMRFTPLAEETGVEEAAAVGVLSLGVQTESGAQRAMLHATHLSSAPAASALRQWQVQRIDEIVDTWRDELEQPPLHILCGDMNAVADSDEMRFLRGLCALGGVSTHWQDAWLRHHADDAKGHTWSTEAAERRALRSCDVDRRLDYIYVSTRQKSGVGSVERCELAMSKRDRATQLCGSDHYGVVADVRW